MFDTKLGNVVEDTRLGNVERKCTHSLMLVYFQYFLGPTSPFPGIHPQPRHTYSQPLDEKDKVGTRILHPRP
jgi:hypothetical protein